MRILYVLGSVPHPSLIRGAGAVRHYHFLRRLLARRHSVTLLALAHEPPPDVAVDDLAAMVDELIFVPTMRDREARWLAAVPRRIARQLHLRLAVRRMRLELERVTAARAFDVMVLHGKAAFPAIAGVHTLPVVLDLCDATSLRQRGHLRHVGAWSVPWRLASYLHARHVERQMIAHSPDVLFISQRDRDAVLGTADDRGVVLPNGIDLEYWTRSATAPRRSHLVFTGVMNYPPNEDAALVLIRDVMPLLHRRRPDLVLSLVGLHPTPAMIEAAAGNPGVRITGYVDDLRPYLEQAAVFVAPIRYASGVQTKVLEALAMEVPVVTTPAVASGLVLDATAAPVRVAADAAEFADAVLALLDDDAARGRLGVDGRQYVEARFSWDRSTDLLERLCARAVGRHEPVATPV